MQHRRRSDTRATYYALFVIILPTVGEKSVTCLWQGELDNSSCLWEERVSLLLVWLQRQTKSKANFYSSVLNTIFMNPFWESYCYTLSSVLGSCSVCPTSLPWQWYWRFGRRSESSTHTANSSSSESCQVQLLQSSDTATCPKSHEKRNPTTEGYPLYSVHHDQNLQDWTQLHRYRMVGTGTKLIFVMRKELVDAWASAIAYSKQM